ncbi:MAG: Sua5/YciO/YrdC/YwlC family protein [Planctomycetota bacterium]|nr:Sua5/YciO/YrdC/YwlC family protein [Planctomycetota bacterium]
MTELIESLLNGQIVALATDTVPGLAIRADVSDAGAKLAAVKGYEEPRPFSLHFGDLAQVADIAPDLPPGLAAWLTMNLPKGVTAVLPVEWLAMPKAWKWPWPKVGLRWPQNQSFQAAAKQVGGPLLMTSINEAQSKPLFGQELITWLTQKGIPAAAELAAQQQASASAVVEFDPLPQLRRGALDAERLILGLRVLVLCSGNICRSPVGEAMLRAELAAAWGIAEVDLPRLGWEIASAGTFAMPGGPASEHSIEVAAHLGLDLSRHHSANLEDMLSRPWDLFLGMGLNHLAALPEKAPMALYDLHGDPVPDPFGGPLTAYQAMCDHLEQATKERIKQWCSWGHEAKPVGEP